MVEIGTGTLLVLDVVEKRTPLADCASALEQTMAAGGSESSSYPLCLIVVIFEVTADSASMTLRCGRVDVMKRRGLNLVESDCLLMMPAPSASAQTAV